jgi:hypothetical protein
MRRDAGLASRHARHHGRQAVKLSEYPEDIQRLIRAEREHERLHVKALLDALRRGDAEQFYHLAYPDRRLWRAALRGRRVGSLVRRAQQFQYSDRNDRERHALDLARLWPAG